MKKIGITLLTAFVGGAVAVGSYKLIENEYADNQTFEDRQKVYFTNNPVNVTSSAGEVDFVQPAAAVTPAVVHIKTTYSGNSGGGDMEDMFEQFFGGPRRSIPQMASGSGVIISDDGYIVTNNHVVDKASKIDIILPDKRSFQAKVIGRDPNTDLALLKVNGTKLPIVKLGNSDNVQVGEWVLAVGYPLSLNTTVTAGIISAKGRNIGILGQGQEEEYYRRRNTPVRQPRANSAIESFLQTDAAINPGNSGGALVNTRGELIGINSAIASQTGSYAGYGFAIPINLAKKILEDFRKYGSVKRGFIGVNFEELDAEKAKGYGVTQITGLYIGKVIANSGAEAAGLKAGDIITKVEGNQISSSADLQERVGRLRPGDKIQLTYLRDGKERSTSVVLKGEESVKTASSVSKEEIFNKLGASFAAATTAHKQRLNIRNGVVVTEVYDDGLFAEADIPKGTVITNINGQLINSVEDMDEALTESRNNMVRIDGVAPDGSRFRTILPIGPQ